MMETSLIKTDALVLAKSKTGGCATKAQEAVTTSAKKSVETVRTWATNNVMTRTITSVMAATTFVLSKTAWLAMEETLLGTTLALKTAETVETSESCPATTEIHVTAMDVLQLAKSKQGFTASQVLRSLTSDMRSVEMD